jgi:host factor-I protein
VAVAPIENNNKEQFMSENHALQKSFLQPLCGTNTNVSIFLVNGVKLHGTIEYMDDDVILLKNVNTQMVYIHAISTVVPGVKQLQEK